jgi:hypothetical protein
MVPYFVQSLEMRIRLLLLAVLTLLTPACRSLHSKTDSATLEQREQELSELPAKKKQAVIDLSDLRPTNGPDAYFDQQAEKQAHHSR